MALKVAEVLEAGKVDEAHVEIERVLAIDPNNKLALSFLKQLTVDPAAELGSTSFPYTIKPGETLSRIAGRFLGDIFQFYILARYNDIAVPRLVPAGQTIRVPGVAPSGEERKDARTARPDAKPAEPKGDAKREAKAAETKPVTPPADARPATAKVPEPPASPPPPRPVDVAKPADAAPAAVAKPAAPEATAVPPPVKPEAAAAGVVQKPAVPPEPTPADFAFRRGLREQAQGNNLAAYDAFRQAYALDPTNREARSNAELMHAEIVADYTRKARAAFAKQDLKGSIENWELLLKFDPGNELAQLERQKALALQERIKSIK